MSPPLSIRFLPSTPGSYRVEVDGVVLGTITQVFRFGYRYWRVSGASSKRVDNGIGASTRNEAAALLIAARNETERPNAKQAGSVSPIDPV